MTEDTHSNRQIQVLRDLGLSRAESEVYLACLNLGANGAGTLSSYRVAQDMGRDPANIGKIVNALVRLQAVRVVQDKPRLFAPVPPEEFTARLLNQMKRRGAEAVTLLESFGAPATDGVAQALTGRAQAFARFRELIASCGRDLLVAGSPDTVRELGADLERVAEQPGRRVRVVSPRAFSSTVVEIAVLPTAGRLGQDPSEDWLVLAVDDTRWLVALVPQPNTPVTGPCGWWCAGSPLARVLADYLESCWRTGVQVGHAGEPAGIAVEVSEAAPDDSGSRPIAAPPQAVATPAAAALPATPPAPAAEPAPAAADISPAAQPVFEAATPVTLPAVPAASAPPGPDSASAAAAAEEKSAPAAEIPAPRTHALTSDEAEQAGFTFLFKHERKPGGDGR